MKAFLEGVLTVTLVLSMVVLGFLYGQHKEQKARHRKLPAIITLENSEQKLDPIVRLHDRTTGAFFCSGTVISANYILTAAHCLEDHSAIKADIEVRPGSKASIKNFARVAFANGRSDLALLTGNFREFNALRFADTPDAVLNNLLGNIFPIVACGYPYGGDLICIPIVNRATYYFSIVAPATPAGLYPGMSGGPVVDQLFGVVVAVNTAMEGHLIVLSPLIELLSQAKVEKSVK